MIYEFECIHCGRFEAVCRLGESVAHCKWCPRQVKRIMSLANVNLGAIITPKDVENNFTPPMSAVLGRRRWSAKKEREELGRKLPPVEQIAPHLKPPPIGKKPKGPMAKPVKIAYE